MTEQLDPRIELKSEAYEKAGQEKVGPKLQRVMVMNVQDRANKGTIKGLHSLDRDPSRTFGNDPTDRFATDKSKWLLGKTSDKPRMWTYVYEVPGQGGAKSKWVREIVIMEGFTGSDHQAKEVLSVEDAKLKRGKLKSTKYRIPDFMVIQMEISDDELEFLKKNNFKVHYVDPKTYYSKSQQKRITGPDGKKHNFDDVFKDVKVLPKEFKGKVTKLFFRVIDYNSPIKGGMGYSGHFLKTRNTMVAGIHKSMAIFDIELAPKARIAFKMRDVIHSIAEEVEDVAGRTKTRLGVRKAGGHTISIFGELEINGIEHKWIKKPKLWNIPESWMTGGNKVLDDFKRIRTSVENIIPDQLKKASKRL